jgi:SAM-dependent methyltransferase
MPFSGDKIRDQQRETWDRFSAGWKSWDLVVGRWLAPVGETMVRSVLLRDDFDILDVATGTGEPGLTAAARVPNGRATLTDLAERMLAVASDNAVARGLGNVETQVCDADALPFADARFDAVLCRFGFMFFPDPTSVARELARVARPGARVSAAVWGAPAKNPWATTIMGVIARQVPMPALPPSAPGLFRCAGDGYLRDLFTRAGLRDITEEEVACDLLHDTAERYWEFMTDVAAPVVAGLARADQATREAIRAEVLELAQQRVRDGRVEMRSTTTVVTGTR